MDSSSMSLKTVPLIWLGFRATQFNTGSRNLVWIGFLILTAVSDRSVKTQTDEDTLRQTGRTCDKLKINLYRLKTYFKSLWIEAAAKCNDMKITLCFSYSVDFFYFCVISVVIVFICDRHFGLYLKSESDCFSLHPPTWVKHNFWSLR